LQRIKKWEGKMKRAENALRKLRKQARHYETRPGGMNVAIVANAT
jgi:hypothetical protein